MKSKEIKEYVEKGYLYVNVLIEIVGNPKEHIEKAMSTVVDTIKKEKGIVFVKEDRGSAEDAGEGLWGVYSEMELLLKSLDNLSWIAFNFMPASIELKEPSKLVLKDKQVTDFMGDILSQLHQVNMNQVQMDSDKKSLLKNINTLIRNAVLLAIDSEIVKKKDADGIAVKIGVKGKELKPVLDAMVKEGSIVQEGEEYARA